VKPEFRSYCLSHAALFGSKVPQDHVVTVVIEGPSHTDNRPRGPARVVSMVRYMSQVCLIGRDLATLATTTYSTVLLTVFESRA